MPRGFTLMEIMIVLGIFTLASIIMGNLMISSYRTYSFSQEQHSAITEARKIIESFTQEIRETVPSDRGEYSLANLQAQSITFYSDIDIDGATERVRYTLNGTTLEKGIIEPTSDPVEYYEADEVVTTLSTHLRNDTTSIFQYFNGDNVQMVGEELDKNSVKLIRIYLKVNIDPNRAPTDYEISSKIQIRNLKENL